MILQVVFISLLILCLHFWHVHLLQYLRLNLYWLGRWVVDIWLTGNSPSGNSRLCKYAWLIPAAATETCNKRATTKRGDDDNLAAASHSLAQQANREIMTLVKQVALKIIPVIPRSDVIFLHVFTMKILCCLIDAFFQSVISCFYIPPS